MFLEAAEVNGGGWTSLLWERAVFGFYGVLWLIFGFEEIAVVFVLGFTSSFAGRFCVKNMEKLW